ncbi:hypothetical protein [Streptomyces roseochromogenus]|uniref:Phage portal protein n=1 Tax=Streptomyces roseochromogenus subsp. oscitans DS 12.976 TaxID=1352936 RepID=V6K4A5_STRRC|nr:hypothetical protein [Streptomyces roseochromogenus]EST26967.1 hypothetical protein M878_26090 [Streptomyces roseochromogenus subsp. oscitans DS 12.976]
MGLRTFLTDAWSWLNYKPAMAGTHDGRPHRALGPELHASWLPDEAVRRLAAYKLLAAYDSNQAGELAALTGNEAASERREFGDPSTFVDTALTHLLGKSQQITVPGAEHARDEDASPESEAAAEAQQRLRVWAEAELLPLRMQAAERKAVLLGDALYLLAWDPEMGRVRLKTYDPGFYFPVIEADADPGDYPRRVHLAWEIPEDPRRGAKARVRRITYELGPIAPATRSAVDNRGQTSRNPVVDEAGDYVLQPGDVYAPESGRIERRYPWAPDRPSTTTCYLTDAEWFLDDLRHGQSLDDLPLDQAHIRTRPDGEVLHRLDLQLDFIPLVHISNTVADGEHFGQSSLAKVMQALDELAETDTDSARASATTGAPIIGLAGARAEVDRATGHPRPLSIEPGTVFQLGDGGRMDVLDTSGQLAELRARVEEIRDRAAVNARLPAVSLGTLDPSDVPSGYALQLSLAPLDSLVDAMRLARAHKYALLLKMVQRIHQAGGAEGWPTGIVYPARLVFGPHTPTDRTAILDEVVKAVSAEVLSLETGVRMLQDAGYPIGDTREEVNRIISRKTVPRLDNRSARDAPTSSAHTAAKASRPGVD